MIYFRVDLIFSLKNLKSVGFPRKTVTTLQFARNPIMVNVAWTSRHALSWFAGHKGPDSVRCKSKSDIYWLLSRREEQWTWMEIAQQKTPTMRPQRNCRSTPAPPPWSSRRTRSEVATKQHPEMSSAVPKKHCELVHLLSILHFQLRERRHPPPPLAPLRWPSDWGWTAAGQSISANRMFPSPTRASFYRGTWKCLLSP